MKVMQSSPSEDGQTSSLISPRDTPSVRRIMSPDTIFVSPLSLVETTIEDTSPFDPRPEFIRVTDEQ